MTHSHEQLSSEHSSRRGRGAGPQGRVPGPPRSRGRGFWLVEFLDLAPARPVARTYASLYRGGLVPLRRSRVRCVGRTSRVRAAAGARRRRGRRARGAREPVRGSRGVPRRPQLRGFTTALAWAGFRCGGKTRTVPRKPVRRESHTSGHFPFSSPIGPFCSFVLCL